jgi:Tfp pilus assembly protein PilF
MTITEPLRIPEPLTRAEELIEQAHDAFAGGNLTAARELLNTALSLCPENPELAIALGHIKLQSGGVDEALHEYLKAVRLNPNLAAAHAGCALAYQWLGYASEAEAASERALSINPMESVALNVRKRMQLDVQSFEAVHETCRQIFSQQSRGWKQFTCE